MYLNITLPSTPYLQSSLFLSGFPTNTLYATLLSPIHATCPAHPFLLHLITRVIFGEQYRSLSSSLCSFLDSPVTSSLLGPNKTDHRDDICYFVNGGILFRTVKVSGPGSSVAIATDYGLDGLGSNPGGDEIFRPSRPSLWPTQPPVKCVPGLSPG